VKRLIVTADDFGLSIPVNEAVEEAHRRGILTAASLMVGAPAAGDAVNRARRMPKLGVGLHLVLVDGQPLSPIEDIPDLLQPDGLFSSDLFRKGAEIFLRSETRAQMDSEVEAQFEAFRRTGLPLDHVNGHHHFHLHPSVAASIAARAARFDVRAVRVPNEPFLSSWRAMGDGLRRRFATWLFHLPQVWSLKRRLRSAGIAANDRIFGLNDSGAMTRTTVLKFLEHLPGGVSELYCHPATRRWDTPFPIRPDYRCVEEFEALVDPEVVAAVKRLQIELIPFAALAAPRRT
jgi:hopanoid biosynthesis associated protein HpnK